MFYNDRPNLLEGSLVKIFSGNILPKLYHRDTGKCFLSQ